MFILETLNGEILLTGEGSKSLEACESAAASVAVHSRYDGRFVRGVTENLEYFFVLRDGRGNSIAISELYESEQGREMGIRMVKELAEVASIEMV
jgi:hypothetical protein